MLGRDFPMGPHWAAQLLGNVLPESAIKNVDLRHREPIAAMLTRAVMFRSAELSQIVTRVRCMFDTLDTAFDQEPQTVAQAVDATFSKMGELQQREFSLSRTEKKGNDDDLEAKFGHLLTLYTFLYEDFCRTAAAPYATGFACLQKERPPRLDPDGRVNTGALGVVEDRMGFEAGILTDGLERHLRNSAAHHRFSVLGDDKIRLWDMDSTGNYTWGPVEWTHWELRTHVYRLANTCTALLLGLATFDITHGRTIVARGWRRATQPSPRRRDIVESGLKAMAQLHGFAVKKVRAVGEALHVELVILGNTELEQNSMIMTFGGSTSRRYRQAVRTEWGPLWMQVFGFLQMTLEVHEGYPTVRVSVSAEDGTTSAGHIVVDLPTRQRMARGEAPETLRALLTENTLTDIKVPVVIRGLMRPA